MNSGFWESLSLGKSAIFYWHTLPIRWQLMSYFLIIDSNYSIAYSSIMCSFIFYPSTIVKKTCYLKCVQHSHPSQTFINSVDLTIDWSFGYCVFRKTDSYLDKIMVKNCVTKSLFSPISAFHIFEHFQQNFKICRLHCSICLKFVQASSSYRELLMWVTAHKWLRINFVTHKLAFT